MEVSPFTEVHHIGICVRSIEATLAIYRAQFTLMAEGPLLENAEVRAGLIVIGSTLLEIFEPRSLDGALGRFLERRGEGLHHLAYRVDAIAPTLAALADRGVRLIDTVPRPGLHTGWQVAFIHPSSAGGVLTELVQVAAHHRPGSIGGSTS